MKLWILLCAHIASHSSSNVHRPSSYPSIYDHHISTLLFSNKKTKQINIINSNMQMSTTNISTHLFVSSMVSSDCGSHTTRPSSLCVTSAASTSVSSSRKSGAYRAIRGAILCSLVDLNANGRFKSKIYCFALGFCRWNRCSLRLCRSSSS